MKLQHIKLFLTDGGRLRLTKDDRSWLTVRPVWASPLTHRRRYLGLLDKAGKEIDLIEDIDQLDDASKEAVEVELHRRYLTAVIESITEAKAEFGATYWQVATNRGDREFVTENLQENVQWIGEHRLLLVDVDGNRFEAPDVTLLDAKSRAYLVELL